MFRRWDCILVEVTYAVIPGKVGEVPIVTEKVCTQQLWKGSMLWTLIQIRMDHH
jgi:hypothetical protein